MIESSQELAHWRSEIADDLAEAITERDAIASALGDALTVEAKEESARQQFAENLARAIGSANAMAGSVRRRLQDRDQSRAPLKSPSLREALANLNYRIDDLRLALGQIDRAIAGKSFEDAAARMEILLAPPPPAPVIDAEFCDIIEFPRHARGSGKPESVEATR